MTRVDVVNDYGRAIGMFINHADLYIVGLDFGAGPYRFDEKSGPALAGSRDFEFSGNYGELNLHVGPIGLTAFSQCDAVTLLARHKPSGRGSGFVHDQKVAVVRLIFAVSEALRFWTSQRDVTQILKDRSASLVIND